MTVIELVDVRRRSPYKFGLSEASWQTACSLLTPSLMFFLTSISATLLSTGLNIIIANRIGAAMVAIFTTTLMMTNLVRTVINQGLNVLWPELTGIAAITKDRELLARWQRLVIKLAAGLALIAAAGTIVLGSDLLRVWTADRIQADQVLIILLALYLIAQSPFLVSTVFGMALNRQSDLAFINLVYVGLALLLSWLFLSGMGLNGAALALLLVQCALLPWQVRLACRWTDDQPIVFVKGVFVRWLPMLLFTLGIGFALLFVHTIWLRVSLFILVMLIAAILDWLVWMTGTERQSFVNEIYKAWYMFRLREPRKT